MEYKTKSSEETLTLGKQLAQTLSPGDILLLRGNLGAGKTTLVKGIAAGFGIEDDITSPTFTLMNVYETTVDSRRSTVDRLVHIDTYRLESEKELIDIGVEDYLGIKDTLCIIEWPEKIAGLLKNKKTIDVSIESVDENTRRITVQSQKDDRLRTTVDGRP